MRLLLTMLLLLSAGCLNKPILPIIEGNHSDTWKPFDYSRPAKYLVLGKDPVAVAAATLALSYETGSRAVERTRVDALLRKQPVPLPYDPNKPSDLLAMGKLAGVDSIILVDSYVVPVVTPVVMADIGTYKTWMSGYTQVEFNTSLEIRSISVETGAEQWRGRAWFPRPVHYANSTFHFLASAAVVRATCPLERGAEWNEEKWCIRDDVAPRAVVEPEQDIKPIAY